MRSEFWEIEGVWEDFRIWGYSLIFPYILAIRHLFIDLMFLYSPFNSFIPSISMARL